MKRLIIVLLFALLLPAPVFALQAVSGGSSGGGGSGTVTSVSGANGITVATGTTTPVVSLPTATAAQLLIENAGATAFAPVTLSGDCAVTSAGAITCLSSNGNLFTSVAFGTALNLSVPPAIGSTTPAAGSFTSLAATSGTPTLTGTNFTGIPRAALNNQLLTTVLVGASPYTILSTDQRIVCTVSGGAISLNLPAATGSQRQIIVQTDSGANNCTVVHNGSDTINGAAANVLVLGTGTTATFVDYASGKWASTEGIANAVTTSGAVTLYGGGGSSTLSVSGGGALSTTGAISSGGAISSTTGIISSTTGAVGPTGGGVLQSYGGTLPTCACTGGSPTCAVVTAGSNSAGQIQMASGTGVTTCTLTFSASGAFHAAPICGFFDANASITPASYSTGAVSTSTAVVDFVAASAANINYLCVGH